jgi:hypothetical protein
MIIGNQYFNKNEIENKDNDYDEINREISKALIDMRNEKNGNNEQNLEEQSLNFSGIEEMNNSYSDISNNSFIGQTISNFQESANCSFTDYHTNHNLLNISNYSSNNLSNNQIKNNCGMNYLNNSFSGVGYYSIINFYNGFAQGNNNLDYNYEKKSNNNFCIDSPKNIIHLDNVLKLKDKRTTLMIRNIPNRYNLELLLNEINLKFSEKFDILYLPLDLINNSNLGFGFINFTNSIHILYFFSEFNGKKWNNFNSGKRCQIVYSKTQGKKDLIKYIQKKNGINIFNNNLNNIQKCFYIQNDSLDLNPEIEIPMQYYNVFINYYPYSLCHKKNDSIFIVDKYYNF